ncbi:GNAT family N-acetyltransferase [Ruegeria sp. Ofav3-42]|uniref:GNAT family N-acetyltransferase n=1 Tax=Ruegeria sp. Ofav3-42 TaxID=2917759 RepID=UPI001EF5AF5C|nr:GNAT family protein [Ruegeria sp. Ofav3-42]
MERVDLEAVISWFQDVEDLARFDRTSRAPLSLSHAEEMWKGTFTSSDASRNCWFVIETSGGEAVGLAGLEAISNINRDAVIAIFISKSARRSGVGLRATALLMDLAFRQLGLNRLTSYYRADNHHSRDLVAKVGCQIEGTMRQAWFADGAFHDMIVVGVLKTDWMARRQALAQELDSKTTVIFGPNDCAAWSWPPHITAC